MYLEARRAYDDFLNKASNRIQFIDVCIKLAPSSPAPIHVYLLVDIRFCFKHTL